MDTPEIGAINEIAVIEKSALTLKDAGNVLHANKDLLNKVITVGQNILAKIEANGGKLSPELDSLCAQYLGKVAVRKGEMNSSRVVYTQIMDRIKSMFTALEGQMDFKDSSTVPAQIAKKRNEYVKQLHEEQQEREEQAQRKLAVDRQKIECVAWVQKMIYSKLFAYLDDKKLKCNQSFNEITLENFGEKSANLALMKVGFPTAKLNDIIAYAIPTMEFTLLGKDVFDQVAREAYELVNFNDFYLTFSNSLKELRDQLIDRLPSKRQELEEAAEQERQRIENEKSIISAKDNETREKALEIQKRLEKNSEILLNDKKQREAEEQEKIRLEGEKRLIDSDNSIESGKAAAHAMEMFSAAAAVNSLAAPENRQGYEVFVTHQAGYVEIFQHWFNHNGGKSTIEELEKKTLGAMRKWCADNAHKTGEKIVSKYIRYEPYFRAINRKIKANG